MVTWTHLLTRSVSSWVVPTNSYNLGLPTLTSPVSWCLSDHRHFDHPSKKTKLNYVYVAWWVATNAFQMCQYITNCLYILPEGGL